MSTKEEGNLFTKPKEKVKSVDRIAELEKEISGIKYNKRTEMAVGVMKAKLANLREKEANRGKGQKKGDGWAVKKSGDATVVLLGFPSVGKSTLLNALTKAKSATAAYAFTTLTCIPGVLEYKSAKIQILDVPGIVKGAAAGTGRGKEVLQVIRNADMVLILLDVFHPKEHYEIILDEVNQTGVRLNQQKPDVRITRTFRGGIDMGSTLKLSKIDEETTKSVMKEMGWQNAQIVFREDINVDQLIDLLEGNKVYTRAITVVNKIDLATPEILANLKKNVNYQLAISAEQKEHMEELKELIYNSLKFIRIYMKEVGKKADMDEPMIVRSPCTMKDICERLHRDFVDKFKFARIWGKSVRFSGQKVQNLKHEFQDMDVLELHIR